MRRNRASKPNRNNKRRFFTVTRFFDEEVQHTPRVVILALKHPRHSENHRGVVMYDVMRRQGQWRLETAGAITVRQEVRRRQSRPVNDGRRF